MNHANEISPVIAHLLAEYDPFMKPLLRKPKGPIKYMSLSIQSELIDCLGSTAEKYVTKEITSVTFSSIMINTNIDIARKDMIEICRYVVQNDKNGDPSTIKICESFVGFEGVIRRDATGTANELIKCMRNRHISLDKCTG
jgi:hypothetical protein